ncbi:MAG: hypothetical protein ABIG56_00465 [Candidatus Omnitrophota bacterium]
MQKKNLFTMVIVLIILFLAFGLIKSTSGRVQYSGGECANYRSFTGTHEVKLTENFPISARPGMIVSVTGENYTRLVDGEVSLSDTLPTVRLSEIPNDKRVMGVLVSTSSSLGPSHWYRSQAKEKFAVVNALGDGRLWVSNINGDVKVGDYITTSVLPGFGQRQGDDLLHSYTVGKAVERVNWGAVTATTAYKGKSYKIHQIAVVYTSG